VHTAPVDFKSWRDRLVLGLAIFIGVSVARFIGPAFVDPLPTWLKVAIAVAGGVSVASLALYSRRRVRRAQQPSSP
jgi:hypothetical protein